MIVKSLVFMYIPMVRFLQLKILEIQVRRARKTRRNFSQAQADITLKVFDVMDVIPDRLDDG